MKRQDDRGEGAPEQAADGRAPMKAAGAHAAKKARSARALKKPVADRSLESALEDRAALELLAGRSLESLVDDFMSKNRSLDNIDAIVAPLTTDSTVNLVKGATVRTCALCSEDVWVAPSSFAAFKGRKMPPIWCAPCAMLIAEADAQSKGTARGRPWGRA